MTGVSFFKERYGHINKIIPLIFTTSVILLLLISNEQDDVRIMVLFIIQIPVYLVFKTNSGLVEAGLFLLGLSAIQLYLNNAQLADRLSIFSFWLLADGILLAFSLRRRRLQMAQKTMN
jgi:hypothetical protein